MILMFMVFRDRNGSLFDFVDGGVLDEVGSNQVFKLLNRVVNISEQFLNNT